MSAFRIVRHPPLANVHAADECIRSPEGKTAMRPFAKLLWTLVHIDLVLSVAFVIQSLVHLCLFATFGIKSELISTFPTFIFILKWPNFCRHFSLQVMPNVRSRNLWRPVEITRGLILQDDCLFRHSNAMLSPDYTTNNVETTLLNATIRTNL